MAFDSIKKLPQNVRDELTDEKNIQIDQDLYEMFRLNGAQIAIYCQILLDIFLQKRSVTDLPEMLLTLPDAKSLDVRGLALAIAIKKLWPINYYLGSVDILIRRLGGIVPPPVPPRIVIDEDEGETTAAILPSELRVQGIARSIVQERTGFSDLYLTQKPIHDSEGRLKVPTVNNWLQDYLHTVGAAGTGSLKRSQYLAKSANAVSLNDAEKKNLLNFLVSYEENVPMYWKVAEEQYLLVEDIVAEEQEKQAKGQESAKKMSDLVALYGSVQSEYRAKFDGMKQGLELEINGNVKKLADILWDSLGFGETDRALATIDLLIDHHWLNEMLKTDHRYQGIVSRAVGVRYGIEAKNTWNGDMTTAAILALFWKLVLVEKLSMDESTAAILADQYRKRLEQKISPIYLDLKSGVFVFREVVYKDRVLRFA